MKQKNTRYPLVKLPSNIQLALYLIQEELKSRKLFHALRHADLHDCPYQPNLDTLILQTLHFPQPLPDETYLRYSDILDKRSRKVRPETITRQAFKAYLELRSLVRELNLHV